MEPTKGQRGEILRRQHERLRATIEMARTAARKALAPGGPAWELQLAVRTLERELLAHLADEERLLHPILARVDAWGPVRLGLLQAEHAHQRAVLAILADRGAWPAARVLAGRTLALCDDLLTDMDFEERELLSERILRDDCILLDASDG
jgi:hypothetical protein